MTSPQTLLRDVFGFDKFRTGQRDIVNTIIAGNNVLAIMPTGGGKSLCYQLPSLVKDGLTLVIFLSFRLCVTKSVPLKQ